MCLAIPGQVIEIVDEGLRLAKVDVAGVRRNVNVGLLDDDGVGAQPGDWVLIHVGFALAKVDEEEARATLALLQGLGAEYEQELEELKGERDRVSTAPEVAPACGCITCGDVAVPMRVLELDAPARLARCEGDALVDVELVGPVAPGDTVLVHAGTAIALLPAEGEVAR